MQDVYKFDARRIIAGRITAGRMKVGDHLVFSPSNKTAHDQSIEAFNVEPPPSEGMPGSPSGSRSTNRFSSSGERSPRTGIEFPLVSTAFRANLFWLGRQAAWKGRKYQLRLATREVDCEVAAIHRIIDTVDLTQHKAGTPVTKNQVAELTLAPSPRWPSISRPRLKSTGRFVLVDEYDIAGGGIITELVHDDQEFLREEARRRDFAWVKGEVGAEDRAQQYGHRAAVVLFTGGRRRVSHFWPESWRPLLVADGRHAYLLDGENLGADWMRIFRRQSQARRPRWRGVTAKWRRLLVDTGLIVVSTTKPLAWPISEAAQAIRTLVHPAPVIAVHMSKTPEEPPPNTDSYFAGPTGFRWRATRRIIEELKRRGVLAQAIGAKPTFQYSI